MNAIRIRDEKKVVWLLVVLKVSWLLDLHVCIMTVLSTSLVFRPWNFLLVGYFDCSPCLVSFLLVYLLFYWLVSWFLLVVLLCVFCLFCLLCCYG